MTHQALRHRDARSGGPRARTFVALAAGLLLGTLALGSVVLGSVAFGTAAPAAAAPPTDLDGAYVLDQIGVLAGDEQRVQDALDGLFEAGDAPLFVIVVDDFDDALDGLAWADETAALSGLGDRDALLAIAVESREYATSIGAAFPASDAELAEAENALVAELRDDRWADGIIAYADTLTAALTAVEEPEEPGTDEPGGTPGGEEAPAEQGGGIPILPIALGAGGIGVAWYLIARARRMKGPVTADVDRQSIAELDQTASRRLVQVDDALTTSEQELGFAEAQFGAAPTEGFRTALTRAKELVGEAFRLRRELDDENPETDEQKRATLLAIITACDEADDLLEAQEEAFEALRDVESDLPSAIAEVTRGREAAPAAIEAAESTVARLRGEFSANAIASVADAPAQARRLLALVDAELAEAAQKQQAGSTSEAAIDVRSAQLALAQLTTATAGVQTLADDLATARTALAAQQDDLRAGIAAAQPLRSGAAAGSALASAVTAAEAALAAAPTDDPIAALERVVAADRVLDTQLAGAREEAERRAKAEAALERTLASASARIRNAGEYIAAHRGAVGAAARARLAEAQAQEAIAVQQRTADPAAALEAAQRALDYAGQAMQSAEGDLRASLAPSGPIGGLSGGLGGSGGSSGIGDAIIGGIIGGLLSGGGGGRSGGGFSGGFGGGRPRFGSSGGSSSGARRSSAPRSSGRRGGGGRF